MSADVILRVRMTPESIQMIRTGLPVARDRGLRNALKKIKTYGKDITPKRTHKLANSFDAKILSPTLITMIWHATSPQGFKYANVVDEGRPGGVEIKAKTSAGLRFKIAGRWIRKMRVIQGAMTPTRIRDHMRIVAPQFVHEELVKALGIMGASIP